MKHGNRACNCICLVQEFKRKVQTNVKKSAQETTSEKQKCCLRAPRITCSCSSRCTCRSQPESKETCRSEGKTLQHCNLQLQTEICFKTVNPPGCKTKKAPKNVQKQQQNNYHIFKNARQFNKQYVAWADRVNISVVLCDIACFQCTDPPPEKPLAWNLLSDTSVAY